MKTSVVMATYNGSRFLEEQLDSIFIQSRQPDEVVFADDCSSDDTICILQRYIEEHQVQEKWRVKANPQNKGYAKNFIEAAMDADGDLIFFADQDDIWDVDHIRIMADILEKREEINLLASNLTPFYETDDTRKLSKKELSDMNNSGEIERYSMTKGDFHIKRAGCTMCIRKTFLEKIAPYWTAGWAHDDFVWKMAELTNSCAVVQYSSLNRRMHANNTTVIRSRTRAWRIKQLSELKNQMTALLKFSEDTGIADKSIISLIKKNRKSIEIREKVVKDKKIHDWIVLFLKYRDCYPRIKGLYLDLYLVLFDSYNGA